MSNVPVNVEEVKLISWRRLFALLLLPLLVLAVMVVVTIVQGLTRYDPQYFTDEYLQRYDTPGSVARALEQALRAGDEELMEELLATRSGPRLMEARPRLIFSLLLDVEQDYFNYLYFDAENYHRVSQYVKEHNGRYIASETDFYYYFDSGGWRRAAGPLIVTWWIIVLLAFTGTYIYRRNMLYRHRRFGR